MEAYRTHKRSYERNHPRPPTTSLLFPKIVVRNPTQTQIDITSETGKAMGFKTGIRDLGVYFTTFAVNKVIMTE